MSRGLDPRDGLAGPGIDAPSTAGVVAVALAGAGTGGSLPNVPAPRRSGHVLARYIVRRLVLGLVVLFLVGIITFIIQRVLPIDPVDTIAGPYRSPERVAAIREQLGLDKSLVAQYFSFMEGLLRGDLGFAWHTGQSVRDDIASRFPASLELALFGLGVGIPAGVFLGIVSARLSDGLTDQTLRVISLLGIALPEFLVGVLLIYVFFYLLGIAPPPLGRLAIDVAEPPTITGLLTVDSLLAGNLRAFGSALAHLFLPAMTLAAVMMGFFARFTRAAMLEVLSSDMIMAARSYGLPPRLVIYKYALKNAMLSVVPIVGLAVGTAMGGVIAIEVVFSWPGLGRYAVDSATVNDFAPVQGFVLVSVALYVVVNLAVDIAQALLDPRVRYG